MSTGVKTHRITDPNDDTRFVDVDPYVVEGIPRLKARVDQTQAGHPTVGPSFNVSSTTATSTGITDIAWTNAIDNEDAPCTSNSFNATAISCGVGVFSGNVRFQCYNASGSNTDTNDGDALVFGFLA
jgi:hypothetical protein